MNKDQFAYLNEEIEALKSERDALKAELDSHIDTTADLQLSLRRVVEDRDRWKAIADKMAEALKKRGHHRPGCTMGSPRGYKGERVCDCEMLALAAYQKVVEGL